FHQQCAALPGLGRAAERRQGRLLRCPTVFEELIKTLCCVNARWAQSVKMAARLVERYGELLPGDPARRAFPTPEALAGGDPGEAVPDRAIFAAFERFHPHQNLVYRCYDWEGARREEVWHEPPRGTPREAAPETV